MKNSWKKLAVAAIMCLATGLFNMGCSAKKSGVMYQREGNSFTDTYILFEDGTYKRNYEGSELSGTVAIETGHYKTSGSTVSFTAESAIEEQWPTGPFKYWILSNPYKGVLNNSLTISGNTYQKNGNYREF